MAKRTPKKALKVGDKVKFTGKVSGDYAPKYYTDYDGIPQRMIIHGTTRLGAAYESEFGLITDIHEEFYIIEYTNHIDRKMRLGFKPDVFTPVDNNKKISQPHNPARKWEVTEVKELQSGKSKILRCSIKSSDQIDVLEDTISLPLSSESGGQMMNFSPDDLKKLKGRISAAQLIHKKYFPAK